MLFSASSASSSPDQTTPAPFTSAPPRATNIEQIQQRNTMQAQNTTQPLTGLDLPPSPLWRKWRLCSLTSISARGLPARDRQTDGNPFAQALRKQTLDAFPVLPSHSQKCHKGAGQPCTADTLGDIHTRAVCWGLGSLVFAVPCPHHSKKAQ